jgi:hypothetical protein
VIRGAKEGRGTFVCAGLLVVLSAMSLAAPALGTAATTSQAQDSTLRTRPVSTSRPFAHQRHAALPCRGCHGSGSTHGAILVRAPRDCAACHHDPQRGFSCTACHSANDIPAERTVRLTLPLRVAPAPRTREVSFPHALHVARNAGLVCTECHGAQVTRPRDVQCGSCHDSHHDGRAECAKCHALPAPGASVHDAGVHLTCSDGACHAPAKAPAPTSSRTLCVFCHEDRRTHEPDGSCAVCHRIPDSGGRAR